MVDLLAGARAKKGLWMDRPDHAGIGVLLTTKQGRVRIKALRPGSQFCSLAHLLARLIP